MELSQNFKEKTAKIQNSLSALIKLIIISSVVYALYHHLWRILFINVLLLILIFLPSLTRRYKIEIPREIELVLLIFVIISFFLGDIRGLVIQIFFGLAVGFVGFALMILFYRNSKIKPNYLIIVLFSLSFSLALAAISELSKYYLKIFLEKSINITDYLYAMTSITWVLVGALISAFTCYIYVKWYKGGIFKRIILRFKKKNPNLFIEHIDSPEEVIELIKKGESKHLEFKSTLRTNLHINEFDRKIEHSNLKTISAFLNSEGGTLLIGVTDDGKVYGIEKDRFQSNDKFNLHFTNLIKEYIGNELLPFLHFELVKIGNRNILKIDCMKSNKPVFLKFKKEEEFYIRVGAATVQLLGSKLVHYIYNNFKR